MVGVESGSQEMLDRLQKDMRLEQVRTTAEMCARHRVGAIFNFIVLAMERINYGSCALGTNPRNMLVGAAPAGPKKAKDFNAVLLVRTRARGVEHRGVQLV